MTQNNKLEISAIDDTFREHMRISNQKMEESVHSECIREQMVKLNTNTESGLNFTKSNLITNNESFSINPIRKKMLFG